MNASHIPVRNQRKIELAVDSQTTYIHVRKTFDEMDSGRNDLLHCYVTG